MIDPVEVYRRRVQGQDGDPHGYEVFKAGWDAGITEVVTVYTERAVTALSAARGLVDKSVVNPLDAANVHVRIAELYVRLTEMGRGAGDDSHR